MGLKHTGLFCIARQFTFTGARNLWGNLGLMVVGNFAESMDPGELFLSLFETRGMDGFWFLVFFAVATPARAHWW